MLHGSTDGDAVTAAGPRIRRAFADLSHGQIHYRTAGSGAPFLMLHASPGSARQMHELIATFAGDMWVIAPDMPGNGDSDPLPGEAHEIGDLARLYIALLDVLGIDRVRIYGSHTGAAIAVEMGILAPARIEQVVLDGVQLLEESERDELLTRYAHPFAPEHDGSHLIRAFHFCRDQCLFFPWYDRRVEAQRVGGLPSARDLNNWVMEVLKGGETYHLNYRAAFRWRAEDRAPLMTRPALVISSLSDPLNESSRGVAAMLPDGLFVALPRYDEADYNGARKRALLDFMRL